jgi:hypothetical protein
VSTSSSDRRGGAPWHPWAPERLTPPLPLYEPGSYVVSEAGEATTWAVFERGRWGLIYECDGVQVLAGWVTEKDIPLHVLAQALPGVVR